MNYGISAEGKRLYVTGNTYGIRQELKQIGASFDGERSAWWIGSSKRAALETLLERLNAPKTVSSGAGGGTGTATAPEKMPEGLTDDTKIVGKCEYQGKSYFLLFMGNTRRGYAARLATMDGNRTFWVNISDDPHYFPGRDCPVSVTKTYREDPGDRRGYGRVEAMTWGKMKSLRTKYAEAKAEGLEKCGKCGGFHRDTERLCNMCGCSRCDGARGGLCEDD